ncbi:MAG: efflux RND transporter periplasmic adaptor subunit [Planctomycetota bacterium]
MKRAVILSCGIAAAALAAWGVWRWTASGRAAILYKTVRAERGDIVQTVKATGVIQPVKKIDVGTQVSGPILKLLVDFNSRVKSGDVVARIDPAVYEARVAQDEAQLRRSQADVEAAKARLVQAEKDLDRAKTLAAKDLVPKSELDAATANRDVLAAQLKTGEAAVQQSEAALRLSRANLDYTIIRSPVDGVIINRNVSEGQTVVASMSAQTIFTIAAGLARIQVEASLPEADIGKLRKGQPVTFTVDAYDREFTGAVREVRLAASTVQNVVTYPVIVSAENPDETLFPGMTSNLTFEVDRRENVLKLPNAALRFRPASAAAAKESEPEKRRGSRKRARDAEIWTLAAGELRPIRITPGITDGAFTEMADGDLAAGAEIVTGIAEKDAEKETVNPFTPKFPDRRNRPPR